MFGNITATLKCKDHGRQPVTAVCKLCFVRTFDQAKQYKAMVIEAHNHLLLAADDCERFDKRLKAFDNAFHEISEVTHAQYCHGLPEDQHHAACVYLLDLYEKTTKEETNEIPKEASDDRSVPMDGQSNSVDSGLGVGRAEEEANQSNAKRGSGISLVDQHPRGNDAL